MILSQQPRKFKLFTKKDDNKTLDSNLISSRLRTMPDLVPSRVVNLQKAKFTASISIPGCTSLGSKQNQDYIVNSPDRKVHILCDGHGEKGHEIAQLVCQELQKNQVNSYNNEEQIFIAETDLINQFKKVDSVIKGRFRDSGCTCIMIIQINKYLVCANVGDSRAIFCFRSRFSGHISKSLSYDHKPNRKSEYVRILSKGGKVTYFETARVHGHGTVALSLSRSFGDDSLTELGVISEPEIISYNPLKSGYLVIASDGLWEHLDNHRVCKFLDQFCDPRTEEDLKYILNELSQLAIQQWSNVGQYRDDISIILEFIEV